MRNFILGTDWWTDCDDAVAVRLLARAHKNQEVRLLGIAINACMPYSVPSLQGFLRKEGVEIPLSIDRRAVDYDGQPPYQKRLAAHASPGVSNEGAEDALRMYRRLLASAEEKVEILEIGFLQVLSALLMSEGDDISPKSGLELLREKVSRFWVMAGKWDQDGEKEHNFALTPKSRRAGRIFCELCPVPVTFLGWEVGYGVLTGGGLSHEDPLWQVLKDHGSEGGRDSWDPMLALLALVGDVSAAGYRTVSGFASVEEETGANHFKEGEGPHTYVVKEKPDAYYAEEINRRIR